MLPTAAVSGFYFAHPDARYFGIGKIGRDRMGQLAIEDLDAEGVTHNLVESDGNLTGSVAVFVDHGLLRHNEGDQVMETFAEHMHIKVIRVNAADRFFERVMTKFETTPAEVLATDTRGYIGRIGLAEHLSPNRRAGMEHFLDRVYQIARAADAAA